VNFDETIKCLASGVFKLKVNLEHPAPVGSLHAWYCASLLQATYRGRVARRIVAAKKKERMVRGGGLSVCSLCAGVWGVGSVRSCVPFARRPHGGHCLAGACGAGRVVHAF
jgi:hypothetical protein